MLLSKGLTMETMIPDIHIQFIKIAVAYLLLGVLFVLALISVLSVIRLPKGDGMFLQIIDIKPPWFQKSLYTSFLIALVTTTTLFWKDLLTIDTKYAAQKTNNNFQRKFVEHSKEVGHLGIKKYWRYAIDFIPHISTAFREAKSEVWISGASFYVSLPSNEELIASKANNGIKIHYLILDPNGKNLQNIAKTFNQSGVELQAECMITIESIIRVYDMIDSDKRHNLQVRLFDESPRARFYIFDPKLDDSPTFFVPHVNAVNSPNIPGFLLQNTPHGLASIYFASIKDFWNKSMKWDEWREVNHY